MKDARRQECNKDFEDTSASSPNNLIVYHNDSSQPIRVILDLERACFIPKHIRLLVVIAKISVTKQGEHDDDEDDEADAKDELMQTYLCHNGDGKVSLGAVLTFESKRADTSAMKDTT
jgi:hypothetical protein